MLNFVFGISSSILVTVDDQGPFPFIFKTDLSANRISQNILVYHALLSWLRVVEDIYHFQTHPDSFTEFD